MCSIIVWNTKPDLGCLLTSTFLSAYILGLLLNINNSDFIWEMEYSENDYASVEQFGFLNDNLKL